VGLGETSNALFLQRPEGAFEVPNYQILKMQPAIRQADPLPNWKYSKRMNRN